MIKEREQTHNLTHTLHFAINEIAQPKDPLHSEIEQLFTDANNLVLSAELQPPEAQSGRNRKQIENLSAGAFEHKNYKRPYNKQYKEYEQAQPAFDPSQIADPLQDFEPDPVPEFVPDFDPSQIYDPLQDYEPEFVPDIEPEFTPDFEPQYV